MAEEIENNLVGKCPFSIDQAERISKVGEANNDWCSKKYRSIFP